MKLMVERDCLNNRFNIPELSTETSANDIQKNITKVAEYNWFVINKSAPPVVQQMVCGYFFLPVDILNLKLQEPLGKLVSRIHSKFSSERC